MAKLKKIEYSVHGLCHLSGQVPRGLRVGVVQIANGGDIQHEIEGEKALLGLHVQVLHTLLRFLFLFF